MEALRPNRRTPYALAWTACAAGCAIAMTLHASPQDALGDGRGLEHRSGSGRALDRGLQKGSGGMNSAITQEDLRARNLVVTGNVAGGRGFRGSVGYTAERDFRGSSSDDTSYAFRAGSAFSDPRVLRAGSMGDRITAARDFSTIEYGRANVTGSVIGGDQIGTRLRFDQSSSRLSAPEARRSMNDLTTAGVYDLGEGQTGRLISGGFSGVRASKDSDAVDGLGLGLYDTARLKQDLRSGQLDPRLSSLVYKDPLRSEEVDPSVAGATRDATGRPAVTGATRIDTGIRTMDAIVSSLDRNLERSRFGEQPKPGTATAPGTDPNATPGAGTDDAGKTERRSEFSRDLEALRREIRGDRAVDAENKEAKESEDRSKRPVTPGTADATTPGSGPTPDDAKTTAAAKRRSLDDLGALLQHGQRIEQLSDSQVARVREVVSLGETAMGRGAFFLAEQHFTMALTLNPGNPLAQAGLANAQLGAGLVSSAAITLRNLYAEHPELIDARFAPGLLPSEARMRELLERLGTTPTDARNAADVGLALAFIGRQLDDKDAMERGLAMFKGTPGDDVLQKLLRRVWLDQKVEGPAPAATPAAPSAPPVPAAP